MASSVVKVVVLLLILQMYPDLNGISGVQGIICYRCDSVNQGETCEANPASRHIRNYGDEEPCLTFEEVNTQYLALQKELDTEWYFSVLNGDHGIPIELLRAGLSDNGTGHEDGPFIHADRDLACLFIQSVFHHDLDEDEATMQHPSFVLWFRKCVQLPAMDMYPVCGEGDIYKGHVELCVCRNDRCNMAKNVDARDAVVISHHLTKRSRASSYTTDTSLTFASSLYVIINLFISYLK